MTGSPGLAGPEPDGDLDALIHRADLDALVRLVDDRTASRDWAGLRRARDRARQALDSGRQLWPVATLAEYRLALVAPAQWAAGVLGEDAGRFTIGPLTEVIAQHHTWAELADLLAGPRASFVAHERALRGETIDPASLHDVPNVLDLPYELAEWEPAYQPVTYSDDGIDAPAPPVPTWGAAAPDAERLASEQPDPTVELAVRQLVEAWTARSNGRAEVTCVAGEAADAVRALGVARLTLAPIELSHALAWLAWAGASGGAHGRRRSGALGRFGALWTLASLLDVADEWPLPLDELGELATDLRWFWWDAGEPPTGWRLQLSVADPEHGLAWAISARDDA